MFNVMSVTRSQSRLDWMCSHGYCVLLQWEQKTLICHQCWRLFYHFVLWPVMILKWLYLAWC